MLAFALVFLPVVITLTIAWGWRKLSSLLGSLWVKLRGATGRTQASGVPARGNTLSILRDLGVRLIPYVVAWYLLRYLGPILGSAILGIPYVGNLIAFARGVFSALPNLPWQVWALIALPGFLWLVVVWDILLPPPILERALSGLAIAGIALVPLVAVVVAVATALMTGRRLVMAGRGTRAYLVCASQAGGLTTRRSYGRLPRPRVRCHPLLWCKCLRFRLTV